jgi:hypothetical protein
MYLSAASSRMLSLDLTGVYRMWRWAAGDGSDAPPAHTQHVSAEWPGCALPGNDGGLAGVMAAELIRLRS